MEVNNKTIELKIAAQWGLVLGIIITLLNAANWIFNVTPENNIMVGSATSILYYLSIFIVLNISVKKIRNMYIETGFSFGKAMGFMLRLLFFAGLIVGVGQYLLQVKIAPEYYAKITEASMKLLTTIKDSQTEAFMAQYKTLIESPIYMIFAGILQMTLIGGLIALVIAAFVKRAPMPENN